MLSELDRLRKKNERMQQESDVHVKQVEALLGLQKTLSAQVKRASWLAA